MKSKLKSRKRLPTGRPVGIPQPKGPERIRRKVSVIYDSILKRALAGEDGPARLCLEVAGEIKPSPQSDEFLREVKAHKKRLEKVLETA